MLRHGACASVFIFVDALDECAGDDIEIAKFIDEASKEATPGCRICVSSRPYPDFKYQYDSTALNIQMEANTSEDIATFVSAQLALVLPKSASVCEGRNPPSGLNVELQKFQ